MLSRWQQSFSSRLKRQVAVSEILLSIESNDKTRRHPDSSDKALSTSQIGLSNFDFR
jgi:hypothetical protein